MKQHSEQLYYVSSMKWRSRFPTHMGILSESLYLYLYLQLGTVFVPIEVRPRSWESSWLSLGAKTDRVSTYPQCADSCKHLFAFFSFQMFHLQSNRCLEYNCFERLTNIKDSRRRRRRGNRAIFIGSSGGWTWMDRREPTKVQNKLISVLSGRVM